MPRSKKDEPPEVPGAELSAYEREQQATLEQFQQEVELPLGLHHGLWAGIRHYVCDFCGDVGYLSLDAAQDHLHRHPQELRELRAEYAAAEMSPPGESAPASASDSEEHPNE